MSRNLFFNRMRNIGQMPINENNVSHLTTEEFLNEIDFDDKFGDVTKRCLKPEVVVRWLNDEINRTEPITPKEIIMSKGNISKVTDSTGNPNIDMFIENITREPTNVFDANSKMEKSDKGRPQLTINTGLPAIVGIVYDEDKKEFYSISTCPSAGACQIGCYARLAFYRFADDVIMKLTQRLNFLLNHPEEYEQKILNEIIPIAEDLKKSSIGREPKKLMIRWNDAGDFFGRAYFDVAVNTTKKLLGMGYDVKSYAYTKRSEYVIELDDNNDFVVNFSTDAHKTDIDAIDSYEKETGKEVKKSHRAPAYDIEKVPYKRKEGYREVKIPLFRKFFVPNPKGAHYQKSGSGEMLFAYDKAPEDLKDYIYENYGEKYGVSRDSLRYTWELPPQDEGGRKYNVIVLPSGDSDISAQREDVRMTFLLEHK